MSRWHTRANLILLLELIIDIKTEEIPGCNTEELYKKSFQNQIICF